MYLCCRVCMQNNKIHTYINISMSCVTIINILSFNSGKMPTKQDKNKVINNFWQVLTHNFFYIFKLKWLIFWYLLWGCHDGNQKRKYKVVYLI